MSLASLPRQEAANTPAEIIPSAGFRQRGESSGAIARTLARWPVASEDGQRRVEFDRDRAQVRRGYRLRLPGSRWARPRRRGRATGGATAGSHPRRELHVPLGPATGTVPSRVATLVAEWTQGEALRPIARLETRRAVRRLLDQAGLVLAEVADDQVTGSRPVHPDAADWHEAATWRELEVELVSGTRDLLAAAGKRLQAAGAQPSASASKLSRLLGAGPPAAGSGQ